ncbi:MAG: HNH endonuclease family protein, partial [Anaerolineae bacterium]
EITVREIADCYIDNAEEGVTGYGGKLNIRPKYQREFVYDDKKRAAVLDTIRKNFPLNVMYWARNEDGTFEVLDGQQRTISFCQYVNSDYSIENRAFHNLTETEKNQILDYKLMIYFCEGNDKEKLDWYRVINIAGLKLTDQELRNAVYTGPWLSDAKLKFSKSNCAAYLLSHDYVNGNTLRQEILETALRWKNKGEIEQYMSEHQHDPNANELWIYFRNVIEWVQLTFTHYRHEMKGLDWGSLYDSYQNVIYDTAKLEQEIQTLMMDDDVTSKRGIYPYVLTHDQRTLNIRTFTESQKREAYERQNGDCARCEKHCEYGAMEADHITPWSKGGKTNAENCQMLCLECNRVKSDI